MRPHNTTYRFMNRVIALLILVSILSCNSAEDTIVIPPQSFYPLDEMRVAAEWEEANGVMFSCPPIIPKELIVTLAKDIPIYPIVQDEEEEAKATGFFLKWGIDTSRVHFLYLDMDVDIYYVRDWGPAAVFLDGGDYRLADVDFKNSDPFSDRACNDSLVLHTDDETGLDYFSPNADTSITPLATQLGLRTHRAPVVNTGGNMLTDGIGSAFSTCIILTESRYNGVADDDFYALNDSLLGLNNYHVVSNYDAFGIQHIDCILKVVDEETLLVGQPPKDHELFEVYENLVKNEFSTFKNPYGKPYRIERIQLSRIVEEYLTAYTNSLILNKNVYVPMFGVDTDSMAIETWRSVMPGYTVKGIPFLIDDQEYLIRDHFKDYDEVGATSGWGPDDALHCRTRAIWEGNKIFISVNKLPAEVPHTEAAVLYATIKAYGDEVLEEKGVSLYWRKKGEDSWNEENMRHYKNHNHWYAAIPPHEHPAVIEYYIEALSTSGVAYTRPLTAPKGFYETTYGGE